MRNLSWVVLVLMVFTLTANASEWVPLKSTRGPVIPSDATMVVEKVDGGYELLISIPGFYKDSRAYRGDNFITLDVPGSSLIMEKGAPELPKMTTFLPLPKGAKVSSVEISGGERVILELDEDLVPSRGHLPRSIDPETVPLEKGNVYEGLWPEKLANADDNFQFGAVSGVRVEVTPFQYDGEERNLRAYPSLRVFVGVEGARDSKLVGDGPKTAEFIELYSRMFNDPALDQELREIFPDAGHMLIVCYDDFADAMKPYVEWKKKSGLDVNLVKRNDIAPSATANQIYDYVKKVYNDGKLTHLMFVGDVDQIPFLRGKYENAPSDACYVKLAGNDNIPDAYHCRISAQTVDQVKTQINKFMFYEAYPPQGVDAQWLKKAVGIASNEGRPPDYTRMDWLREPLLAFRYTHMDQIYDPSANATMVANAVNDGRSMIHYIGHGSSTSWGSSRFNVTNINQLTNDFKLPMIWSVACVNGQYEYRYGDCFAEAWIKAGTPDTPRGAIGILASTTNEAWVPPCDMQTEINNQVIAEKIYSLGGLTLAGMLKAFEVWGSGDRQAGNQLNEQNVLFSDSSLLLRNDIPKAITATAKINGNKVDFTVNGAGNYARVTIYNSDLTKSATGIVKNGKLSLNIPAGLTANDLQYTVHGYNLIPLVDQDI